MPLSALKASASAWGGLMLGHDRMPDKIAADTDSFHEGRLERQKGQNLVDVALHLRGAPFAPGPDRRRHIVDDPQVGARFLDRLGNTHVEVGAVDRDQNVGLFGQHGINDLVQPLFQLTIPRQHLGQPHDAEIVHVEQRFEPLFLHLGAAHAAQLQPRNQGFQP